MSGCSSSDGFVDGDGAAPKRTDKPVVELFDQKRDVLVFSREWRPYRGTFKPEGRVLLAVRTGTLAQGLDVEEAIGRLEAVEASDKLLEAAHGEIRSLPRGWICYVDMHTRPVGGLLWKWAVEDRNGNERFSSEFHESEGAAMSDALVTLMDMGFAGQRILDYEQAGEHFKREGAEDE